jgi:hypothetical protein
VKIFSLLFACAFAASCLPGLTGDGDGSGLETKSECNGIAPVQTEYEACCKAYGIDACGAGLFCENFDGREYGTCYPLHSRRGLEQCSADDQCAGGLCNPDTGLCKSAYLVEACTAETGCVEYYSCANACPGYSSECSSSCQVACELRCIP